MFLKDQSSTWKPPYVLFSFVPLERQTKHYMLNSLTTGNYKPNKIDFYYKAKKYSITPRVKNEPMFFRIFMRCSVFFLCSSVHIISSVRFVFECECCWKTRFIIPISGYRPKYLIVVALHIKIRYQIKSSFDGKGTRIKTLFSNIKITPFLMYAVATPAARLSE